MAALREALRWARLLAGTLSRLATGGGGRRARACVSAFGSALLEGACGEDGLSAGAHAGSVDRVLLIVGAMALSCPFNRAGAQIRPY